MTALRRHARLGGAASAVALAIVCSGAFTGSVAADRAGDDLSFGDRGSMVEESTGRAVVSVERDPTLALEESNAWFTTVERTADGSDFSEASGWLRMAVGQTSATIVVHIHDDIDDEPLDETFAVRLTSNAYGGNIIDETLVTIRDDDDPPEPVDRLAPDAEQPANARPAVVAAATPAPHPAVRPVVRANATPRQVTTRRATPRVTPFELRAPDAGTAESLPVPEHASPLVAATFIAALALARVSAEIWFRLRLPAS